MIDKDIEFLKNIKIEDVEKFYHQVTEDDFQIIKIIIEDDVLHRVEDFPDLTTCLIFILEETSKLLISESNGLKIMSRDIKIDKILKK
jgi:hypothetical protein